MNVPTTASLKQGYITLAIKLWSELSDFMNSLAYILTCCKFQIIILKTVEVAETWTILCNVYKIIFLVNPGYVTQAIKKWSEFYNLYAHAQSVSLLWCKFQTIILKTVGEDFNP